MQPARGAAGRMNADGVLAIVNFSIPVSVAAFSVSANV